MRSFGMTLAAALLLLSCSAWATVYTVPGDAATIQEAISFCVDGDSVVVGLGIHTGTGNRDISLLGRKITVRSTDPNDAATVSDTVIDCEDSGRGFVFDSGETDESVVAGFTIINGNAGVGDLWGGGLYFASGSSPIVRNCVIVDCSASSGGAIAILSSSPTIKNCRILGNIATGGGGAIYINGGNALFENCVISGNSAPNGGAVYSQNPGDLVLAHCTITTNTATYGGAINCFFGSSMTLYGCILWDNVASTDGSQMYIGGTGTLATVDVSYCDIEGIDTDVMVYVYAPSVVNWGLGNIEAAPMFIEAGYIDDLGAYVEGDFGLLEESPCLDAGDPDYVAEEGATDVYGAQRIFGEAIDIGAAEFVTEEIEIIEAKIKLWPRVINLRGKQKWFFCAIKLEDYQAEDIDADSIVLEETIKPKWARKFNRVNDLIVRFDMDEIRELIDDSQKTITLTVQGTLNNGAPFEGYDELKIHRREGVNQIASGIYQTTILSTETHTITLTVTDNDGAAATDTLIVTINQAPNADAGADQTVVDTDDNGSEEVTLDGSGSSDVDGTIVSYVGTDDLGDTIPDEAVILHPGHLSGSIVVGDQQLTHVTVRAIDIETGYSSSVTVTVPEEVPSISYQLSVEGDRKYHVIVEAGIIDTERISEEHSKQEFVYVPIYANPED